MRFHYTLLKMGKFRLDISKKFSGAALFAVSFFALMFYLMYFSLLGVLWLIYGIVWIALAIPRWIIGYFNRDRNDEILDANNVPKILRSDKLFWFSVFLFPPLAIFMLFLREDKKMYNRILLGLFIFPYTLIWILFYIVLFS